MYHKSYVDIDPRRIVAKFKARCPRCHTPIKPGDSVVYYPREKRVVCNHDLCGGQAMRDLVAANFDEAMYGGSW